MHAYAGRQYNCQTLYVSDGITRENVFLKMDEHPVAELQANISQQRCQTNDLQARTGTTKGSNLPP